MLIVVITAVKIVASLAAPYLTDDPELVAGYLGLANGLGFLAGATVGYIVLRANLKPPGGRLIGLEVIRTILVTIAASLIAGLSPTSSIGCSGLETLTDAVRRRRFAAAAAGARRDHVADHRGVLLAARVPDAHAAVAVRAAAVRPRGRPHSPRPVPMALRPAPWRAAAHVR